MEHLSDASPHYQAEATPGATKGADPRDVTELPTHASGADAHTGKCKFETFSLQTRQRHLHHLLHHHHHLVRRKLLVPDL